MAKDLAVCWIINNVMDQNTGKTLKNFLQWSK